MCCIRKEYVENRYSPLLNGAAQCIQKLFCHWYLPPILSPAQWYTFESVWRAPQCPIERKNTPSVNFFTPNKAREGEKYPNLLIYSTASQSQCTWPQSQCTWPCHSCCIDTARDQQGNDFSITWHPVRTVSRHAQPAVRSPIAPLQDRDNNLT
jgi:hypothetical protein